MGSLPDAHECRVDFEHVRDVPGALRSDFVFVDTENSGSLTLGGTNAVALTQSWKWLRLPDGSDTGVDIKRLSNLDDALSSVGASARFVQPTKCIIIEAAIHKQPLSVGADGVNSSQSGPRGAGGRF